MKYELAKKLKEAGFPQNVKYGDAIYDNSKCFFFIKDSDDYDRTTGGYNTITKKENTTAVGQYIRIPTLSELIDACGDDLLNLEHVLDGGLDGKEKLWWASSKNHGMAGETPDDAVTYLWLALNNK